ncbi:MAG: hypothetical protein WDM85_04975 [Caulobacteraceae bacterium]
MVVSRDLAWCADAAEIAPDPAGRARRLGPTPSRSCAVLIASWKPARFPRRPVQPGRGRQSAAPAPTSGPTARPTSITSNWCAAPAAQRCRRAFGSIR